MPVDSTNGSAKRGGRPPTPGADVVEVRATLTVARIPRLKVAILEGLEAKGLTIQNMAQQLAIAPSTAQRLLNADTMDLDFALAALAVAGQDMGDVVSTDDGLVLARNLGALLTAMCAWHVVAPEAAMAKDDDGEE